MNENSLPYWLCIQDDRVLSVWEPRYLYVALEDVKGLMQSNGVPVFLHRTKPLPSAWKPHPGDVFTITERAEYVPYSLLLEEDVEVVFGRSQMDTFRF